MKDNPDKKKPATPDAEDRRSIAEITELVGGLAHELRNPLSTMMVNLKLLTEDLQQEDTSIEDFRRRALIKIQTVRREAQRLQSLFDEFLSLTGPYQLKKQPTDLGGIIQRLIEFLDPMFQRSGVEVHVDQPETPVVCLVDEMLLSQALLNIALNAQDAMPDGGSLTLGLAIEGNNVSIRVKDTGMGIGPQDAERIFRPFFSTKAGGTGLGLSITRRVISEHGGTLSFHSEPGEGTTFTITLPMDVPGAGAPGADRTQS